MSKSFLLLPLLSAGWYVMFSGTVYAQVINPVSSQVSTKIPNIAGNWKMSISGDGDNKAATCTLIQKGNALTGTFRGQMGDLPIVGTVTNDKKLNFTVKFMMGSLKFAGTVDGQTMQGIVDLPMGQGQKNWTATK
jgi:hypothetical protein